MNIWFWNFILHEVHKGKHVGKFHLQVSYLKLLNKFFMKFIIWVVCVCVGGGGETTESASAILNLVLLGYF